MEKIHLLMKKEEIDQEKLNDNQIVVVFDILLATSTITAALAFGAKEVIPVVDQKEALSLFSEKDRNEYLLIGEHEGDHIEGFLHPNPMALKDVVLGKSIILSTTNGTVALKNSQKAKTVYAASILNSKSVAEHLSNSHENESIILICSGSSGHFNIEDFYGAGYFIECLLDNNVKLELTDAAKSAYLFYTSFRDREVDIISDSRVGKMITSFGFEEELKFVCNKSYFNVVPIFYKDSSFIDVNKLELTN